MLKFETYLSPVNFEIEKRCLFNAHLKQKEKEKSLVDMSTTFITANVFVTKIDAEIF